MVKELIFKNKVIGNLNRNGHSIPRKDDVIIFISKLYLVTNVIWDLNDSGSLYKIKIELNDII